jgi:hypothetical protein
VGVGGFIASWTRYLDYVTKILHETQLSMDSYISELRTSIATMSAKLVEIKDETVLLRIQINIENNFSVKIIFLSL